MSSPQYTYPNPRPSSPSPSPSPSSSLESLPDSAPSSDIDSTLSEESESDAEKEWQESLQQLELILTVVLVPYVGKYFGRKCAYWGECDRVESHVVSFLTKDDFVESGGWEYFVGGKGREGEGCLG